MLPESSPGYLDNLNALRSCNLHGDGIYSQGGASSNLVIGFPEIEVLMCECQFIQISEGTRFQSGVKRDDNLHLTIKLVHAFVGGTTRSRANPPRTCIGRPDLSGPDSMVIFISIEVTVFGELPPTLSPSFTNTATLGVAGPPTFVKASESESVAAGVAVHEQYNTMCIERFLLEVSLFHVQMCAIH